MPEMTARGNEMMLSSWPGLDVAIETGVKFLAPNWHLHSVEGVLHDIVRIKLVHPPRDEFDVGLCRLCDKQKLGTADCLKAIQAESGRLEHLEARWSRGKGVDIGRLIVRRREQTSGDGVDTVESTGQNQHIIATEFGQASVELAVVYQAARLVDDQNGEYHPFRRLQCQQVFWWRGERV
jgi:hypothetical protein